MTDPTTETRLQKLEELCAHQAAELETLSDTVRKQWDEIDRLTRALRLFKDKLRDLEDNLPAQAAQQEKPPHY